jgi:hypothetical protein
MNRAGIAQKDEPMEVEVPPTPSRADRAAAMIAGAPGFAKNTLSCAFSGAASPRGAIKAMCLCCTGYDRSAVRNCTGWTCPLWAYQPYQGADPDETRDPTAASSQKQEGKDAQAH